MAEMTPQWLAKHCKEQKMYKTPELNDKLYLHFKGFQAIENLEPYTGLKALFLEGNAIDSLEGLSSLTGLRCLYMQQNCITEIEEGTLDMLTDLRQLNLSNNNLKEVCNIGALKELHSLQLASNHLRTLESLHGLTECPSISVLDLSNNNLDGDGDSLIALLQALPDLSVLYLVGNPIVNQIRSYRKTLISKLPKLAYLDDRPIFESERLCAEAWAVGGIEAEREERRRQIAQKEVANERQMEYMRNLIAAKKPAGSIDIDRGSTEASDAEDSEEDSEEEEEPPELVAARKRLAAYSARPGEAEPRELTKARAELRDGGPTTWQPQVPSTQEVREVASPLQVSEPEAAPARSRMLIEEVEEEEEPPSSTPIVTKQAATEAPVDTAAIDCVVMDVPIETTDNDGLEELD